MAMFSRKHYQTIAAVLYAVGEGYKPDDCTDNGRSERDVLYDVAENLALTFEYDNSAFDREHFLAVVHGQRPVNSRPRKGGN